MNVFYEKVGTGFVDFGRGDWCFAGFGRRLIRQFQNGGGYGFVGAQVVGTA